MNFSRAVLRLLLFAPPVCPRGTRELVVMEVDMVMLLLQGGGAEDNGPAEAM